MNYRNIIKKATKGDREAFGKLYDLFVKQIYSFVYLKTGHKETTEDLVALTFTKALKSIHTFKTESGTSFQAWLYKIARNNIADYYRKHVNTIDIDMVWNLSSNTDFLNEIASKIELEKVMAYLKTLSQDQQEIIVMRLWQQLTYQEIAEVINKSEAACKMDFSRGLSKLRQTMPIGVYISLLINVI